MATGLFNLKQVNQAISQGAWSGYIAPKWVEYLVVAGGGGGGYIAGGGGAGGLLTGIVTVAAGTSYTVTVGSGGAGGTGGAAGASGVNTVFGAISSTGGGAGGSYSATAGASGGSGGGATNGTSGLNNSFGQGISGQGNAGGSSWAGSNYTGGGGGGAGTVGLSSVATNSSAAGNGGAGIASSISGSVVTYAGGGGGAADTNGTGGSGGVGGGGAGGISRGATGGTGTVNGASGTSNTGGGGGGYGISGTGGTGGSGIVIVSYPDVYAAATTVNATASTSGSGSTAFSSSAYIRYAGQSAFALGSGDFTIEGWFYSTALGSLVWDFRNAGATDGTFPTLELSSNGQVQYFVNGSYRISSAVGLNTVNTWAHIAIVRSGTVTKMFFNGTQAGSSYTDTTNYTVGAAAPFIGCGAAPSAYFSGYISNFRVVKGVCVYTGTFTPPTAPLQATQPAGTNIAAITSTSTSLLLNTNSGAFLADNSTNSFTQATSAGTLAWNASSPFTGTGYKNRVYTWTSSGSITF